MACKKGGKGKGGGKGKVSAIIGLLAISLETI